ncbi:MAG: S-layer homology domain-containing protein [Candidatus Peregrinibacteria bacterium]|nr:S-layer homology domain-containing protein [Candidatus Peregrinibacteria bacterium]
MKGYFKKNFIFYAIVGIASMYAMTNINVSNGDFKFLETSLVTMLENVAESNKFEPVDLGIQNVTLRKISNPTQYFNHYKYVANIVVKNYGGDLKNGNLILEAGDGQKHSFVKNDAEGFSLGKGQSYIIENYEILFDGDYNGGKLTVEIKLPAKVDYFEENNKFEVNISDFSPKIKSLSVTEINEDGTINLEFDPLPYTVSANGFEVYKSENLNFEESDSKYAEASFGDKTYGYYRIKNSENLMKNGNWSLLQGTDRDPHSIKFAENPFTDSIPHYIYLKSTNPENGNFIVSNIIELVPQTELNRAAFAKFFVEYTGVNLVDEGTNYFEDVSENSWYAPYVKTLCKLGLIKSAEFRFNPENSMTRGDALRVVMDYFDANLADIGDQQPFQDIDSTNTLFPYAEALFDSGKAGVFGDNFQPNQPATKNYLKYLIYEYKKNS